MRKFRISDLAEHAGSTYPEPFDAECRDRYSRRLTRAAGISQFGANQVRLAPGAWSSQRHWHTHEDELVIMLQGEAVLVSDEGETVLQAGDAVGFAAGEENGHHIQNRSEADCVFLAFGSRDDRDEGAYPDIDLHVRAGRYSGEAVFTNKRNEPY